MLKKYAISLYRSLLILLGIASLIVVIAALFIQFWFFPHLDRYRDTIAHHISHILKHPIQLGHLEANWQGIRPHLSIKNLTLLHDKKVVLIIPQIDAVFSWWSIPTLEPRLAFLGIRHAHMTLRHNVNNEWFIGDLPLQSQGQSALANWLLSQPDILFQGGELLFVDEQKSSLTFRSLSVSLQRPLWQGLFHGHRLTFNAYLNDLALPIRLQSTFYGNDVEHYSQWYGTLNVQLKELPDTLWQPWLAPWLSLTRFASSATMQNTASWADKWLNTPHSLTLNHADFRLAFAKQHIDSLDGRLAISASIPPFYATPLSFKGHISWHSGTATPSAYNLNLRALEVRDSLTQTVLLDKAYVNYHRTNANTHYGTLGFEQLQLNQLQWLSQFIQAQAPSATPLTDAFTINGILHSTHLNWRTEAEQLRYHLRTKFSHVDIPAYPLSPTKTFPALSNFSGELDMNEQAGTLEFDTHNAMFNAKNTLRWAIPIRTLRGALHWEKQANNLSFSGDDITFTTPHLSLILNRVRYQLPLDDTNAASHTPLKGQIDLLAHLNGNLQYASFYYPMTLDATTLHWLDTSILSGTLHDGELTLKGDLARFPFDNDKNGIFNVRATLQDVRLEYGVGWPEIKNLHVKQLEFNRNQFKLLADNGWLYGNQITSATATIPAVNASEPMLHIRSELKSPAAEAVRFINNSPVKESTQGFNDGLIATGNGKLSLDINIPMRHLENARYTGSYRLTNGTLNSPYIPSLTQINGTLNFTESSLNTNNVNASLFNAPLTFSTTVNSSHLITTQLFGKTNAMLWQQVLGKQSRYFTGSSAWNGTLRVQKPDATLDIHSNLLGVRIALPAPFAKGESDTSRFSLRIKQDSTQKLLAFNLNDAVYARLSGNHSDKNGWTFTRGVISFNERLAKDALNPTDNGLSILGNLDYLDVDAWRTLLGDNQSTRLPLQKINLRLGTMILAERSLHGLELRGTSVADTLQLAVDSQEIKGNLQLGNTMIRGQFSELNLPAKTIRLTKPNDTPPPTWHYPALDIRSERFSWQGKYWGALTLSVVPQGESWNIQQLTLNSPSHDLRLHGVWQNSPHAHTQLYMDCDLRDTGATLSLLQDNELIKGGAGKINGNVDWQGTPEDFSFDRLNGNLQFELKQGQILKVKSGIGRLLNLLSLQNLPKRLSLDFKDILSNSFYFDVIKGGVTINKGIMNSNNFTLAGPSADIVVQGEVNLSTETQHLFVKVSPHISDSLSLATFAGGPIVGAVTFITQKLLKDPLNKMISNEYEIVGTWDNPQEVIAKPKNKPIPHP